MRNHDPSCPSTDVSHTRPLCPANLSQVLGPVSFFNITAEGSQAPDSLLTYVSDIALLPKNAVLVLSFSRIKNLSVY